MRCFAALLLAFSASVAAADTRIEVTRYFDLHSDPWLNLHHFLYQWARADEGIGEGRQKVDVPERESIDMLNGDDRDRWDAALDFYRRKVAHLSHFDDAMLAQKFAVLRLGGDLHGQPEDEIEGIGAVLVSAMPVYLDTWWPDHDEGNRQWVANLSDALAASEADFVALTARLYGAEWPNEPRRIDVSAYANFRGGYTALGHVVMYASDPGVQGIYGLEMLYHEVQHVREISGPSRVQLREAFGRRGMRVPQNLSHGIIFGTAGAFAASIAGLFGQDMHEPYWDREGFAGLSGWASVHEAVTRHWLPAVEGDVSVAEALDDLVAYFEGPD